MILIKYIIIDNKEEKTGKLKMINNIILFIWSHYIINNALFPIYEIYISLFN